MNAELEHIEHTAAARADHLSEAFGDDSRLLGAQDRHQALVEGLAFGLRRVAVAVNYERRAGLVLKNELQVVVTQPIRGVTPSPLAGFDEVAYVATTADDGISVKTTSEQWCLVEQARELWKICARGGTRFDAEATAALSEWFDQIRRTGYCR